MDFIIKFITSFRKQSFYFLRSPNILRFLNSRFSLSYPPIIFLIYRFNSSAKEVELKSEATSIAVEEIEKVKQDGFEKYDGMNKDTKEDKNGNSLENQKVENKEGFFKTIIVQDYADLDNNSEKISNLVKKVTVKISYMFQAKEQSVELSTILSKEN